LERQRQALEPLKLSDPNSQLGGRAGLERQRQALEPLKLSGSAKRTRKKEETNPMLNTHPCIAHGFYAEQIIFSDENPEEFNILNDGYVAHYKPQDIVEQVTVSRIVVEEWNLRRLNAMKFRDLAKQTRKAKPPMLWIFERWARVQKAALTALNTAIKDFWRHRDQTRKEAAAAKKQKMTETNPSTFSRLRTELPRLIQSFLHRWTAHHSTPVAMECAQ
jgi:hypothetical protein